MRIGKAFRSGRHLQYTGIEGNRNPRHGDKTSLGASDRRRGHTVLSLLLCPASFVVVRIGLQAGERLGEGPDLALSPHPDPRRIALNSRSNCARADSAE